MRSTDDERRPAEKDGGAVGLPSRVLGAALALGCMMPDLAWSADDPRDADFLSPILQSTLETAKTNVEVPWFNPVTGNGGIVMVERTFYREPDRPCRSYVRTLEPSGQPPEVTKGTGCRTTEGRWLLDEDEPATSARRAPGKSDPATRTAGEPAASEPARMATGPTCPDTVLVPMPSRRPPELAYTMPARAEL